VVTDEGRAESGNCRYTCVDINRWFSIPKPQAGCSLVTNPPAEAQMSAPPVNSASTIPVPGPSQK